METPPSFGSPIVLLNPTANRGNMQQYRTLVRRYVEEPSAYVETTRRGELEERAMKAASEGHAVVVAGGDGSVHEAVNGVLRAERRVPLGIVPAGSGNDYAWNTLGIPREPAAAVERAFHGHMIDSDAGTVNERFFANSFSIGLDADIAVAAGQMKKYPLMSGTRLYYSATLRQLLFGYHRCPWLRFSLDEQMIDALNNDVYKHYVLMAVTNGPTYGAGFRINPSADYTDGLFDVCTITYTPLPRALRLLPQVQRGEHAHLPEVTFYRAKTVHIESRLPVNIQMDGETMSAKSFEAHILPKALLVRV